MEEPDIIAYCELMEEIKRRTNVINAFGCGRPMTPYQATNIECVYLQFRKILELIAFGSLVANKSEFSKVYNNFSKFWNAQFLLRDIERINPDFYPQPIAELSSNEPGVKAHLQPKKEGFLTQKDFLKLYEKCGALMHARNPYGSKVDYEYYQNNIQEWLNKITRLLSTHKIRLVNSPHFHLIHMKETRDDKVHHYRFVPKPKAGVD